MLKFEKRSALFMQKNIVKTDILCYNILRKFRSVIEYADKDSRQAAGDKAAEQRKYICDDGKKGNAPGYTSA